MSSSDSQASPKLISVVIPAFNESECVEELAKRLMKLFEKETQYEWQVIIVENGSHDDTWEKLRRIAAQDKRFEVVKLARNFGMDGGLTAGLDYARGDACVLMTADLQDPPEMISDFLRYWEQGYENVYGIVNKREGTSLLRRMNSRLFYWFAGKLTDQRIPKNASDFRLVDKKVYMAVREMRERNRFVRGLVAWTGFKTIGVSMSRPPRFAGASKAYSFTVLELAFKGIFAHSYLPLRLITVCGISLSVLSLFSLLGCLILWVTRGVPFAGFGTIISIFLVLFGVLTFMLGVVSEYVGLIYEEVKGRPNFIVADVINA